MFQVGEFPELALAITVVVLLPVQHLDGVGILVADDTGNPLSRGGHQPDRLVAARHPSVRLKDVLELCAGLSHGFLKRLPGTSVPEARQVGTEAASLPANHVATGAKPLAVEDLPPRFPVSAQFLRPGLGPEIGNEGDHAPQVAVGQRLGWHLGPLDSVPHHLQHVVIVDHMGELPSNQVGAAESPATLHSVAAGAVVAKEALPDQDVVRVALVGVLLPLFFLRHRQGRDCGGRAQDDSHDGKDKQRQPSRESSHAHLTQPENGLARIFGRFYGKAPRKSKAGRRLS